MYRNLSLDLSTDSDVFLVERSSAEGSPIRKNTPAVLNSTELSEATASETITTSSVASPEPQIVTIDSYSNEPTIPYGFGNQHAIVPLSPNDLNLPHNPFNVLATMAVIRAQPPITGAVYPDSNFDAPMNVSTNEGCETTHTTRDDATFYTDDESRPVVWIFL